MNAQTLVAKVWNFAHVLRDQGVSYQACISQISDLLFLKMDESALPRSAKLQTTLNRFRNVAKALSEGPA